MNGSADHKLTVFAEALQLPAHERAAYLERACGGDEELRRAVEALLQEYDQIGDFLEKSPSAPLAKAQTEIVGAEKPGDFIGGYKLLEQIGEGGCGVVYMAEQTQPVHRKVALKIIKPGMDTKSVIARFETERQMLALMDHPAIAKIFDAGATQSGRPYFVMELVRGIKITDYCDEHSMTTEDRLKLFIQVCQAVQHAHQKGIIHRDIKPSNILVTTTLEGAALPVVIDFGVAKATTNQQLTGKTLFTAFETLIGTPAYMSPEQAAFTSVDVDTRTDIYSLGVLLYELLTGSTPFDTEALLKSGLDETRRVIREEYPARPSMRLDRMRGENLTLVAQNRGSEPPRLIRTVRGDLDWIAMKALEKDRTRRYETADSLAEDIKRFLSNEAVSARPPTAFYRFQKTVQRNGLLFIGIGVITILLVVSLILVSASLAKERQSRREAKQVKQFLEEMLQGVGPDVALGRDTAILREILDQAAARVGRELTNQPAVEAELQSVIGTLYYKTGQLQLAEEAQRKALAIRRKQFGSESPETAASLNELGLTLMANGKLSEAELVNREALDIRQRCFGNDNADVATSQNNLAHVYSENGKLTEGEALARQALATRQRLFGNDSLEAADSLRSLVVILGDKRQWTEAEAMARKVLEVRRKKLGPDHAWVASALDDVAWAAAANGKQKEAEDLEREALAMRQKLLSPEHPDVAASLYLVGDRMRQEGKIKEAYPVLSAALSIQSKVLGEDHPSTLYTLKSLGLVYIAEYKWSEAETVFREVLAAWRNRVGNKDLQTLYAIRDLADVFEYQGKWAEAESLHREELASLRVLEGNGGSETAYTLHKLGATLDAQRKWSEAERVHREQAASWRKRAGNDDPQTLFALRELGITLEYGGKWTEAESVHREELTSWRKRVGNDDPQTLYTLDRLGWTLEGEGKWSEAESVYREALASHHKQAGNDDPLTLSEYESLARVLTREKKFGEAEQLLTEALTPAFIEKPACCNILARRLDLMGRQGRWKEAAADAATLMRHQPAEYYWPYNVSVLSVIIHDRAAYEQLCHSIATTFAGTTNSYIAQRIADGCLLLPDSRADQQLIEQLATRAVTLEGRDGGTGYFQACKALSEYREGHFAEAAEWAEKALKSSDIFARAEASAALSMTQWRLGQKDKARGTLSQGNKLAPEISSAPGVDLGDGWLDWLVARILLDEAGQLIQPDAVIEAK